MYDEKIARDLGSGPRLVFLIKFDTRFYVSSNFDPHFRWIHLSTVSEPAQMSKISLLKKT